MQAPEKSKNTENDLLALAHNFRLEFYDFARTSEASQLQIAIKSTLTHHCKTCFSPGLECTAEKVSAAPHVFSENQIL